MWFLLCHLDLDFIDSIVEFFCAVWWFCNLCCLVDLDVYVCDMDDCILLENFRILGVVGIMLGSVAGIIFIPPLEDECLIYLFTH